MGKGGGGGGPQTSEVTQTTSRIPAFAEPFYREMIGRAGYETTRPYEPYPGQRLADFTAAERAAQAGIAQMAAAGVPSEIGMASDIASQVGYAPQRSGTDVAKWFDPRALRSGYTAGDIASGYTAGELGQGYEAGQRGMGYEAGGFDPGYTGTGPPGGAQFGPGFDPRSVTDEGVIERYMDPFQRMVTDVEKREAQRQSDIQATGTAQQAAQAGGLGGYREGIMQAERERNLLQQMGDIEARGGQRAWEQAQRGYEADRAARLQAGQLGLQTGQAREQALQQAAQFGMTAQQAEDAARQAQEQFGQSQFAQNEQMRQAQQQADTAVFQAGEAARQEAGRLGLSAQETQERVNQAESAARMQADQFNTEQQYRRAQLWMAGLGEDRAGQQQRLEAAGQLGQFGGQRQKMGLELNRYLQAMGQGQRELAQRGLEIGYQDFLQQRGYPREQLTYLSNLIQGLPIANQIQGTQTTAGGPSNFQNMISNFGSGVGLYNRMGAAGGGRVPGVTGIGLHRALRGT